MQEIASRPDIELLVNTFYEKVLKDDVIGYIFNDIADVNWDHHFPTMYSFWEKMLLGTGEYAGNPMQAHMVLNKKETLKPAHFQRWLALWEATLKENFEGAKADEALTRAKDIARLMEYKVSQA